MSIRVTISLMCCWLCGVIPIEAAECVKVGAIFAKTGNATPSNLLHLEGIRFAVEKLNAGGPRKVIDCF